MATEKYMELLLEVATEHERMSRELFRLAHRLEDMPRYIGSQLDTGTIYIDWRLIECCRYSFHDGGSSSGAGDQEDAQQQANDEIEFSLHTNHLIDSIPAPSMRMSAGFYR